MNSEVEPVEPLGQAAPALSADATVFVPGSSRRVLKAHSSRERSPPPRSSTSSSAPACPSAAFDAAARLPDGTAVTFAGLVSRPVLVGKAGTVLSFDEKTLRYAVKVTDTGESVRVLEKNLMKP